VRCGVPSPVVDLRFSLAGLIVGTIVGLTGVGGSAILAPVLILFLGVKPSIAIGTDLLYSVPTKLFALGLHARRKTVDWRLVRWLLAGGVPGALGGLAAFAILRSRIDHATLEVALRHAIGCAILLACVGAVATWIVRRNRPSQAREDASPALPVVPVVAIGAVVGFLVALTSIGSGSVTLPLLVLVVPAVALRRLIGSEIAFAAFLVPLAAVGHLGFGDANLGMAAALLVGSLPGVWIGSRLVPLVGDGWLRPIVVGTLAFAGSRLI